MFFTILRSPSSYCSATITPGIFLVPATFPANFFLRFLRGKIRPSPCTLFFVSHFPEIKPFPPGPQRRLALGVKCASPLWAASSFKLRRALDRFLCARSQTYRPGLNTCSFPIIESTRPKFGFPGPLIGRDSFRMYGIIDPFMAMTGTASRGRHSLPRPARPM